jgi:tetratricopeptide (TPR) repeat protein
MVNRQSTEDSNGYDPVMEVLRGGDPAQIAQRAGMPVEELLRRRDAFLQIQSTKAMQDEMIFRKVGRNEPCPCGSGRKYKKCCMHSHQEILGKIHPAEVHKRRQRENHKNRRDIFVQEGYALLTAGNYEEASNAARRWLDRFPEDDRFHDIMATAALYLGRLEEAIQISESRWKAAESEKAFFLAHGIHSYDDPEAQLGHAYAPQAWLEKYWVALRARDYAAAYPKKPDPQILSLVRGLQEADDLVKFPQSKEEGLQTRKEALADIIQALKEAGPQARAYLTPLCTRYSWTALLIPEILSHWADEESTEALVDIALFHYPFLSESCLKALELLGQRSLPHLKRAFARAPDFDALKIGLISVAGQIGTPEALDWVTSLLDHPDPAIVNRAGEILGKAGYVQALDKLRQANLRIGGEPRIQDAIDKLSQLPA